MQEEAETGKLTLPYIAHYNDIIKQFYTEQNMNVAGDWSEHSTERIATLDYLKGCKNLRETLNNFGFKLL